MVTGAKKFLENENNSIEKKNFALIDLTRRPFKGMRKSELVTKAREKNPKRFFRLINKVTKVTDRTNDAWVISLRATLA